MNYNDGLMVRKVLEISSVEVHSSTGVCRPCNLLWKADCDNQAQMSLDQKRLVTVESRVVVKSSIRLNERETPEFGVAVGSDPSNIVGLGMEPDPVGALGAGGVGMTGAGLTGEGFAGGLMLWVVLGVAKRQLPELGSLLVSCAAPPNAQLVGTGFF